MENSSPFIMRGRYPQEFLDSLAESLGIKWTKVSAISMDPSLVEVRILPPPSNALYYLEHKYDSREIKETRGMEDDSI